MLVTPEKNRRNQIQALVVAGLLALAVLVIGLQSPPFLVLLVLSLLTYWLLRRRCLRRLAVMNQPFPAEWERILREHVKYFVALDDQHKERFRQLVKVFLSEVRITGIRTDVDDTIRVLIAASAAIPIFGFNDFEYRRLGEVLVYPAAFDKDYKTRGQPDEDTLGMVGLKHLSGVMILSKPALLAAFGDRSTKEHVGIHEFAHLIEEEEADVRLPPEVPEEAVQLWVQYVAGELAHPQANRSFIDDYAYTNEHEFFAVLTEYFFKSPELLREKDPKLYRVMRDMFHQDPWSLFNAGPARRQVYGRNDPCPCNSGKKYRDCCLAKSTLAAET